MSWFNSPAPATDGKRGADALVYFHNEATRYPQNYSLTFDQLKEKLQADSHGKFLDGFGFAINSVPMADGDVQNAMIALADAGEGKLPEHWNDFFGALSREATSFHFVDAVATTATGTIADIGSGLAQVGDTVLQTAKNAAGLVTLLPYVAFAALGFYLYLEVKKKQP